MFFVLCWASSLRAQPEPFQNQTVLSGLDLPTGMAFLPDGRLLVLLKKGEIVITDPNASPPETEAYMVIGNIATGTEKGLTNIVLDPQFEANGYFYLYYSRQSPLRFVVSRFIHRENEGGLTSRGDLDSEVVIWEDNEQIQGGSHYGGGLDFLADGTLLLGTGDEEDGAQSQDLARAGGKLHRFNPDGSIPVDNPFFDGTPGLYNAAGYLKSIYALGLRNPFRARFDAVSNRYLIGDVGGNDRATAWEEVNLAEPGANYGWPLCEGPCGSSAYTDPLFGYPQSGSQASVIGGIVYRGTQFPAEYRGAYFYGDYARHFIRYLTFNGEGNVLGDFAFIDSESDEGNPAQFVIAIEQSPDGALYYFRTTRASPSSTYAFEGELRRVVWSGSGNLAPECGTVTIDPERLIGPGSVTFSATVSDAENDPLTYEWVFGDGSARVSGEVQGSIVPETVHTFAESGVYSVQLLIADVEHPAVICGPYRFEVGSPPEPVILSPADGALFRAGDTIRLSGTATDPEDGELPDSALAWSVVFSHNDHTHPVLGPERGREQSFTVPEEGHGFSDSTAFVVLLRATDSDGVSMNDRVTVFPEKVWLTFSSQPAGFPMTLDGIRIQTDPPKRVDQVVGHRYTVRALTPQCIDDIEYRFERWSTGEAEPTTEYVVPESDDALQAGFAAVGPCSYCGTALGFDGEDDRVTLPEVVLDDDFSIEFWARFGALPPEEFPLLGHDNGQRIFVRDGLLHVADSIAASGSGGAVDQRLSITPLAPNLWHHVALVRRSGALDLMLDGRLDASVETPVAWSGRVVLSRMGNAGADFLEGALDEVRVWSRARTPDEIAADLTGSPHVGVGGLVAHWSFNEPPTSQVVVDSAGGGFDAVLGADASVGSDDPNRFAAANPPALNCAFRTDATERGEENPIQTAPVEMGFVFPNPVRGAATVRFAVREAQPVTLALFDATGRRIRVIYTGRPRPNQANGARFDISDLPGGVYFLLLQGPSGQSVRSLVRIP